MPLPSKFEILEIVEVITSGGGGGGGGGGVKTR